MAGDTNSMVYQTETLPFGRPLPTYQQNHPGSSYNLKKEPEISLILLVITGNHLQNYMVSHSKGLLT
jgi:hypothetical protein